MMLSPSVAESLRASMWLLVQNVEESVPLGPGSQSPGPQRKIEFAGALGIGWGIPSRRLPRYDRKFLRRWFGCMRLNGDRGRYADFRARPALRQQRNGSPRRARHLRLGAGCVRTPKPAGLVPGFVAVPPTLFTSHATAVFVVP